MNFLKSIFSKCRSGKLGAGACLILFSALAIVSQAFAGNIVILGDSQNYENVQRQLVRMILQQKPAIVFRVGDLVDYGHDPRQWEVFNDINRPLLKTTEYFPALGNHEMDSWRYFANFPTIRNQRWYSVSRQGIHFVVLDSNSDLQKGSIQLHWLESDLRAVRKNNKFIVVIFHHPLFSVGAHTEDEKGLRAVLLPLFKKYGVGGVFSGHDHSYQRFLHDGMAFVITGGGGSFLVDQARNSPELMRYKKVYHFCLLFWDKQLLRCKVIDIDSNVIDEFIIPSIRMEQELREVTAQ